MQNAQITVNPYLTFDGNCREAMNFYNQALKGELSLMPFEGAQMDYPPAMKDKILHSNIKLGNAFVIMASDSMPGQPIVAGNNNSISLSLTDVAEGERIFKALSAGGTIIMPFADAFWGAKYGMFIDKFGMNWMVNCELPKSE